MNIHLFFAILAITVHMITVGTAAPQLGFLDFTGPLDIIDMISNVINPFGDDVIQSLIGDIAQASLKCVATWRRMNPHIDDRFNLEDMLTMCAKKEAWRIQAEDAAERNGGTPPSPDQNLTPDQQQYWHQLRDCRGSGCLDMLAITGPEKRAIRKEYRMLTRDERKAFHDAVNTLHNTKINGTSRYDILVNFHLPQFAVGAHGGPAFLPFHREYMKQYELALRLVNPTVALPYWDSSLDQQLPNPTDSIMWTEDFMGTSDGPILEGPFRNWTATDGRPLQREVSLESAKAWFLLPEEVQELLELTNFEQFSSCHDDGKFEHEGHGEVHAAIGGHMSIVSISPNDPIFWMHHAFIDYMWEQSRQHKQHPQQRQIEFPDSARCEDEENQRFHNASEIMYPFVLITNQDGLSNIYTEHLFKYQPRPVCMPNSPFACGDPNDQYVSPYLFCDTRSNTCVAKVKPGGDCSGFREDIAKNVCYNSNCNVSSGRCE